MSISMVTIGWIALGAEDLVIYIYYIPVWLMNAQPNWVALILYGLYIAY